MSDSMMRAWLLDGFTGLGGLRIGQAPRPVLGPDDVLIRVRFAALNPADRFLAENLYPARPSLPHILGRDGGGVVEVVGRNVKSVHVGQTVAVLRSDAGVDKPGTFAEFVAIPQEYVVPIPDGWSEQEGMCAALVYLTAHQALTQWGRTRGETVLITGVSGGVGVATLQLAQAMGHKVIGLSRSPEKRHRLAELGADLLLDTGDPELKAKVKEFTSRKGVDLVVENVGGPLFNTILDMMGYGGRISVVGALAGDVPTFNPAKLLFRRTRIGGILVFDYKGDEARNAWSEVVTLLRSLDAHPLIDSVFAFEKLPDAFTKLAAGPLGKVVLKVD